MHGYDEVQAHKLPIHRRFVYNQAPLANASPNVLGGVAPFPYGQVYNILWLDFYLTVAIGTGTGAITEGELMYIKNILIKSDKHDVLVNATGRSLWYRARRIQKVNSPYKDAMAAASATYKVSIPIHFKNDNENRRPHDTALDMSGVEYFEVNVTLGSVADLFTTVGTSTVSTALNITVEKSLLPADKANAPLMQLYLYDMPPQDPTVSQNIEFEKTKTLGIRKLMIFTSNNTASAGVRWTGQGINTIFSRVTFEDEMRQLHQQIAADNIQFDNLNDFPLSAVPAGLYIFDMEKDHSFWSAYGVGGKARVNLNWTNGAGAVAGTQVSVLLDAIKTLR